MQRGDGEEALSSLRRSSPTSSCSIGCCRSCRASRSAAACAPSGNPQRADHHADGARRGDRPHPRPRHRRRRLSRQAVLADGADGAPARRAAPHRARRLAEDVEDRRHRDGPRRPRCAGPAPGASRAHRVPAARVPHGASGPCLSRAQLLDAVWGRDVYVEARTVDVHIGRLRKALIRGNARDPIRTVRSAGYVFGDRADA